jgi:RNA polymerase sigma factor (TIGR02999 family)
LVGPAPSQQWDGRAHFFAVAAEAMRRILVESARRKKRLKHGGQLQRVNADEVELPLPMPDDELLALDEALDRLASVDSRAADVVKLCFFVGLTHANQYQSAFSRLLTLSHTVDKLRTDGVATRPPTAHAAVARHGQRRACKLR